jgi:uncharacterized protein YeeX (DUF496 family)
MKTEFSTGDITKVYLNKITYKLGDKEKRYRPTLQEFKECFEHLNHYFTLSENNGKILEQSIDYFKKTLEDYEQQIEDLTNKNMELSKRNFTIENSIFYTKPEKKVILRMGPFTLEKI